MIVKVRILRFFPFCLVAGGTLNAPSRPPTSPPPTKTSGSSTSLATRMSGRTWPTRGLTWSNGCWPGSPTTTRPRCLSTSPPMTRGPIPASTAASGCLGWTKRRRRARRESTRACTRKVRTARRSGRRRGAGCASSGPSSSSWTRGWCPIGSEVSNESKTFFFFFFFLSFHRHFLNTGSEDSTTNSWSTSVSLMSIHWLLVSWF